MSDGYTDEEFWQLEVPSLDARVWWTFGRLQRERDDARRVAKVLAELGEPNDRSELAQALEWRAAEEMALAYPKVKPSDREPRP
jgi:hypothetical protein